MLSVLHAWSRPRRIYLDAASTTPVDPRVLRAMRPYEREHFANPGSLYREGVEAARAISEARVSVARILSARAEEITFTSGGTEANNLALRGLIEHYRATGRDVKTLHVVTTAIEHSSVLVPIRELEREGLRVSVVPVTEEGIVDLEALRHALTPGTVLVSVHFVNNEIGTVQPLRDVARLLSDYAKERRLERRAYLHTDASQAPLYFDCSPEHLSVDLMTLDGQKMHGPKGVGALYHRHGVPLRPLLFGGGQEGGLRPGTEPVPLIVGFAEALSIAGAERASASRRVSDLRDRFLTLLKKKLPQLSVNGSLAERAPNNLNISIPGIDAEFLVITLDRMGVAAATRSACLTDELGSYVVAALGKGSAAAQSALRLSLPKDITWNELRRAAELIARAVQKLDR